MSMKLNHFDKDQLSLRVFDPDKHWTESDVTIHIDATGKVLVSIDNIPQDVFDQIPGRVHAAGKTIWKCLSASSVVFNAEPPEDPDPATDEDLPAMDPDYPVPDTDVDGDDYDGYVPTAPIPDGYPFWMDDEPEGVRLVTEAWEGFTDD